MVSIVMPCRNAASFLPETLESLRAQTFTDWELIVVDDKSTDRSREIIQHLMPEARIVAGRGEGVGAALNEGLSIVRGEYIAFIDADDLWVAQKLSKQMRQLDENPQLDGSFVLVEQFSNDPRAELPQPEGRHRGALLVRRRSFDWVGAFRADLELGEFIDWCARADEESLQFGFLPERLYRRRNHDSNTMRRSPAQCKDLLIVVKQAMDRRRSS